MSKQPNVVKSKKIMGYCITTRNFNAYFIIDNKKK